MKKMSLRAVLEKKLSFVERAVESNPANVDLKLEKFGLCKELWERTTLQKGWKKLAFIHPNSAPLWRKYLLFTQSHFSTFSVSKVNSVFRKCLSTFSAVQDGSMVSHPPLPGTQEDLLDIFLQQCHFLRQVGHTEKTVCLFQALLDFTFFKSDSVKNLPTRQQVLFDDIGPSMIRVDRPDLQLQLILSFLQFLGLPGPSGRFSTTSSSNILLDDLAFLEEGPDPERPLTSLLLRLPLTDALSLLPFSASLWQLYLQTENHYHNAGHARRFFHSVAKKTNSIVPCLFAITSEQRLRQMLVSVQRSHRPGEALPTMPNNGLSNRICCLFENATATEHGSHCPLLQRMYLNFMVCDGNAERGSGILYKALQAVPWVKGLYMDAVQLFPERVQEFLDLMTEKQLRL
ncbi:hypothetical protein cypCar_00010693 [Cyprinus carpio]|nr:hypothetical protein cypCar_00010693 [Cyprinus carpio]